MRYDNWTVSSWLCMVLVTVVFLVGLSGCQALVDTTQATANAAIVNEVITSGQAKEVITSVELTDTEKALLTHAYNRYMRAVDTWSNKAKYLDSRTPIFLEFQAELAEIRRQYEVVRKVVTDNYHKYGESQKLYLVDYEKRAEAYFASMDNVVALGDRYKMYTDAIELAKLLALMAAGALTPK